MKNDVARAMLRYRPMPINRCRGKPNLEAWSGLSIASKKLLQKDPNAFLIACLFDHLINADKAWEVPAELRKRMGHLDIVKIAKASSAKLETAIRGNRKGDSLHRFPSRMAKRLKSLAKQLVNQYKGNAALIWSGDIEAQMLLERLKRFDGIGQKIANMMSRLLVTYYGVHLTGWNKIDIAVDRHVARVFLRSGLVKRTSPKRSFTVSEVKETVIEAARHLSPRYPGALDEPAFFIGREWCTADYSYCDTGLYDADPDDEPCPLNKVCLKRKIQVLHAGRT